MKNNMWFKKRKAENTENTENKYDHLHRYLCSKLNEKYWNKTDKKLFGPDAGEVIRLTPDDDITIKDIYKMYKELKNKELPDKFYNYYYTGSKIIISCYREIKTEEEEFYYDYDDFLG